MKEQSVVFPNAPAGILFPGDPVVPRTLPPIQSHDLARQTVLHFSYVGTQAHHLLVLQEVNPGNPAACLALSTPSEVAANSATCGPFGESGSYTGANGAVIQGTRSNFSSAFGGLTLQQTIANSHDNALEASVSHSSRGLFFQLGYTWSKSIDQSSSLAEAVYPVSSISPTGAKLSRALSAFDLTHNFVATYSYTLPLERLLAGHPLVTRGWQVSGLTRLSTGFPVTLYNNNDTSLLGSEPNGINNNGIDEPEFTPGNLHLASHPTNTSSFAFNTSRFSLPELGTLGNARQRFFYGPGADNTDLTLRKSTPLKREARLETELQAFNVFNHSHFFGPAAVNGNLSSGTFGQFQNASAPRLLQVALRLAF